MERNVKHLLLRTDVLKTSRKENLKKCTNFEEQKGTRYIYNGKRTFIMALPSSAVFRLQNRVSDFFQIVLFGK